MTPPILSLALPSETGRVLSIQSHTVQVLTPMAGQTLTIHFIAFGQVLVSFGFS